MKLRNTVLSALLIFCMAGSSLGQGEEGKRSEEVKKPEETTATATPVETSENEEEKPTEEAKEPEEIVVTATRIETPEKEVASSVTVIRAADIAQGGKTTVLDLLRDVPGIDIAQTGTFGGSTSAFIRGANADFTLVLIDGVEVNDPISVNRAFNFANLTVDNIDRIEIVRGPQSVLYGSDAMGGVINIITKKGEGKPKYFLSLEGGSFDTLREAFSVSGGDDLLSYSFALSRLDTNGISAADEDDGNSEEDRYENITVSARIGLTPTEQISLDFIVRHTDAFSEIDFSGGPGGDDPNFETDSRDTFFRTEGTLLLFDGVWEHKLGLSLGDQRRGTENDADAVRPLDTQRSSFKARTYKADWQQNLYIHETNTLTLGVETEREMGRSRFSGTSAFGSFTADFPEKRSWSNGIYLQDQVRLFDCFFATVGARIDKHKKFGSETTYRVAPAYIVKRTGTKFKGSYGKGFKAPSLFQLFSSFGDPTLDAQKSKGWDAGIEQALLNDRLKVGVTYFRNDFDDLVDFDFATSTYKNIAEAKTKGFEATASAKPTDNLTFIASYTRTDTEDEVTGLKLLRRAKHKYSVRANYRFLNKGNLNIGLLHVGDRDDIDPASFARTEVDDYNLVTAAASYDITERLEIFGRVENLLDEDYQEVAGYGTPNISGYIGLKLSF